MNCEIIDTGGQEKFNSLNKTYYKRADGCLLVYDISSRESFEECKNFYKNEIVENCKKNVKVILIGNKNDLEEQREISEEEGSKFAEENNYFFKETSCEKNFNVADAFETIIIMTHNDMIRKNSESLEESITEKPTKIDIESIKSNKSNKEKKKKKCC